LTSFTIAEALQDASCDYFFFLHLPTRERARTYSFTLAVHILTRVAKAAKTAAIIVGVVALTVATAGLFAPAATAAFLGSISAGLTLSAVTTALTLTASALSIAAGIMAKRPSFGSVGGAGQQLEWTADPTAGMPYVMGNARVGEAIVHQASWGDKNKFLGIVGVLSCAGPILAHDGLYADNTLIGFSNNNAVGYYHDWMLHHAKIGTRPSDPLPMHTLLASPMPDWSADHKLSSLAASGLILVADTEEGKIFSGGTPKLTHQIRGVRAYDARQDDTNGGSGVQRPGTATSPETQYQYSENPWVHHGTYALGRWVEGVRVIGPGLPKDHIDWPSHIEAANVADTNGWAVSGRVLSTDRKWEVLKAIAQAGGGYPIPTGAKLACLINTPRVSLATIEEAHLKGPVSAPQMAMRRDRLNGAIPRYRSPDHAWEVVSGEAVRNSTWATADGGNRTREIDLPLVAEKQPAAQLIAYEVANSRERSPIGLELDLVWSQYRMGDCLTLNLPSALLINQKAVIIGRELDAASNTVRFEFRTEDDDKHAWALGQTGTAPPTTTVGSDPGAGDNPSLTLGELQSILRDTYPKGLTVTANESGGVASITLSNFTLDYPSPWSDQAITGSTINGLAPSTNYFLFCDVDDPDDLTPTFGATTVYGTALNSSTNPRRIFLNQEVTTPASGSGGSSGGTGTGGGYGGGTQIP
jgi:trimeric autotransporter adhesin